MNRDQIMEAIRELSKSQGLYCRILEMFETEKEMYPEEYEDDMKVLEEQNFKDSVDLVLYFEC